METQPKPRLLSILDTFTAVLFVSATALVLFFTPQEVTMGAVQKVFYFHVSTAWVGMLGFLVAAIAGIFYLAKGTRKWDIIGLAAVEVSVVFFFIAIVSGSIWARPAWGKWWTWEPRLTTATIVELVYAAYLMLRQGIEDPDRRARFSAVYAILGFISVPLTFFSIRIWRTIHPDLFTSNEGAEGGFSMSPRMRLAFFYSLIVFTFVFVTTIWHRIRLGYLQERVEQLRLKLSQ